MKKLFLSIVAMLAMVCSVNAQVEGYLESFNKRTEKLQTLLDGYKISGFEAVDEYGNAMKEAALASIANSVVLENMYKRQIGETADGVTDVTIKKPSLEEWIAFGATITSEGLMVKKAVDKVQEAADEAKKVSEEATKQKNPMKAAKAAKKAKAAAAVVEFGNEATPILLEESAAKAEAVKNIIETIKSGKNL